MTPVITIKNRPLLVISALVIVLNIIFGVLVAKNRSVPRLLLWNITAVRDPALFAAAPGKGLMVHYEQSGPALAAVRERVPEPLLAEMTDLERIEGVVRLIAERYLSSYRPRQRGLRWGSPAELAAQIKQNIGGANCFHFSILFNSYVQALGYNARLWALEGDDGFERFGHTVVEVYVPQYQKWIMLDPSFSGYFRRQQVPLSLLELKKYVEQESADIETVLVVPQEHWGEPSDFLIPLYRRLVVLCLLRDASDFETKFSDPALRWGMVAAAHPLLNMLPYYPQRAAEYFFGRREFFYQYNDERIVNTALLSWSVKIAAALLLIATVIIIWLTVIRRRQRHD